MSQRRSRTKSKAQVARDVDAELKQLATTLDAMDQPLLACRLRILATQIDGEMNHDCDDHCSHDSESDREYGFESGAKEMKAHIAEAFKTMPAVRDAILEIEL